MKFEEWLSQQNGVIEVDCGCVTTEAFYHWMRVAYEAGNSPVIPDGYVMVPNDGLIAELLTIAKEAADDADVFAYSEFNNKSMRHSTAIADWERRAAMLAAAPHDTPALNSLQSVDSVTGGWIPVSERMPEDEQEVLTINRMGHCFVSFFDKHSGLFFDRLDAPAACCIEHVLVTHWMPLPAAPQEVNRE